MPKRHILLHIGAPKCGSTYLQRVMLNNQVRLVKKGISYPHTGTKHPGNAPDLAHVSEAEVSDWFAPGIHTVILSHEDLLNAYNRGKALAQLAKEMDISVQVLAFLRPYDDYIFGAYSQAFKQKFDQFLEDHEILGGMDFEAYAQDWARKMRPATALKAWDSYFDLPVCLAHFKSIKPTLKSLLRLPWRMDWTLPKNLSNPSLRMSDCDALVAAFEDKTKTDDALREQFKAAFHLTGQPDPGRTPARRAMIEAAFADHNAGILEAFGYDNRAGSL